MRLLSLCVLVGVWINGSMASVISSRVKITSDSDGEIACENKLIVTIAIEGGNELETEYLQFDLSCLGSVTCPCPCDYATDPDCTCRDLDQTLNVGVTKTPVHAAYPLTYVKAFNFQVKEVVHSGLSSCTDGEFAKSPTCGWYKVAGEKVADSQGFCCECTTSQVLSDTFGSLDDRTRANLNCDYFDGAWNFFVSNPSSAHCLYYDPLWYQGFELGEAAIDFAIDVSITNSKDKNNSTTSIETLTLSPSEPHKRNQNGTMEAELLGDLAGYTQLPVLSNKMLMIPFPPGSSPASALSRNQEEWMIVGKSKISIDGVPDSVTGGCSRQVGTCLQNQLRDLYTNDLDRVSKGKTPKYLAARYAGDAYSISQYSSSSGGNVALQFPVAGIRNSVVTITAAADNLRFVQNSSPGKILNAEVCAFNNVSCGIFAALSDRGYLHVQIQNTGYISSQYTVAVTNCSDGVLPTEAQRVQLLQQEIRTIPAFLIQMSTAFARRNLTCWTALVSSLGEELDSKSVTFSVGETEFEDLPGNPDFQEGNGPGKRRAKKTCSDYCPNIFNIFCLLFKRCWTRMLILFAIIAGIFAAATLFLKGISKGWYVKFIAWWLRFVLPDASNSSDSSSDDRGGKKRGGRRGLMRTALSRKMPSLWTAALQQKHQNASQNLMTLQQQYQDRYVYLNLSAMGHTPSWLYSPGPHACLAGTVRQLQVNETHTTNPRPKE